VRLRLLIVKLSSLGDLFHALPAVHNIKHGLDADVDWLVQAEYADLVRHFTDVDQVLTFRRRAFFRTLRPFLREIRAEQYDMVVDLQGLFKSALATRLARGGRRIGPSYRREGAKLFYTDIAGKADRTRHAVDQACDVVSFLGLQRLPPEFPVAFPRRNIGNGRKKVALLPRSRWPSKNWPTGNFAELARRLSAKAAVYLIGSKDDADDCEAIASRVSGECTNLAGKTNLVETGSVLQEMDLLISNDSGPVHMAAALGTPTLVLFGPTDPTRTGPYGEGHRMVRESADCQPCFSRRCNTAGMPCIERITVDRIEVMAWEMLDGTGA
jgi:heptosyltransferase I